MMTVICSGSQRDYMMECRGLHLHLQKAPRVSPSNQKATTGRQAVQLRNRESQQAAKEARKTPKATLAQRINKVLATKARKAEAEIAARSCGPRRHRARHTQAGDAGRSLERHRTS